MLPDGTVLAAGSNKYGSEHFKVTADRNRRFGMGTTGWDDDGVKTTEFPIVREGILVGLQTNRETAHYMGDDASLGCTGAASWRDYPFLRMPTTCTSMPVRRDRRAPTRSSPTCNAAC